MLELARAWWQTHKLLQQDRKDIEDLPARIKSERAQLGTGGRYAYIHTQNLAKNERDLETAKAMVPELEKQLRELEQAYSEAGFDETPYSTWTAGEMLVGGRGIKEVGSALDMAGSPAGLQATGVEFDLALGAGAVRQLGRAALKKGVVKAPSSPPQLPTFTSGGKTTAVLRTQSGDVPLLSGRAGPAASLPKGTPGFNAISKTHVEGHAGAVMRQRGIKEATIYINNPRICVPCERNLATMLPAGSKLTVVLPDGTSKTFIGNAR
jgi:hypothetical protein